MNLARLIYNSYPDCDLLPINPEVDCRDMATFLMLAKAGELHDGLLAFIVTALDDAVMKHNETPDLVAGVAELDSAIKQMQAVRDALQKEALKESRLCPKCGQDFSTHNDDGSCVEGNFNPLYKNATIRFVGGGIEEVHDCAWSDLLHRICGMIENDLDPEHIESIHVERKDIVGG